MGGFWSRVGRRLWPFVRHKTYLRLFMAYTAQDIRLNDRIAELESELEQSEFEKTDMQARLAWYLERVDRYSDGKSPLRVLKKIEKTCPRVMRYPIALATEPTLTGGPAVYKPSAVAEVMTHRFVTEVFIGLGEDASPEVIAPHVAREIENAIYKYFRAQSMLVRTG